MASHSLFPKSVPTIAVPNPHKRKPSLSTAILKDGQPGSTNEDVEPVPPIPLEHRYPPPDSPPLFGRAVTTESPIDGIKQVYPRPPPPQISTSLENNFKTSPDRPSNDSGYQSTSPQQPKSPVVPIRSMFPTYNPNIPLSQQNYIPQRPVPAQLSSVWNQSAQRQSYIGDMQTPLDRALGPRSRVPSVANYPLDALTPRVSTQRDLEVLWDATHGMEPNPRLRNFDLELARTEEAKFTLGNNPTTPFYTLVTYDTNELAITKTNPRKPTSTTDVSINAIEPGSRRYPPNDGLVTFIFPKTAAMLAINQSMELAREHELAPTHRDEIQAEAVKRAANQEASNLRWNDMAHRYELEHPAVGRGARGPNFVTSPATPHNSSERPVLHITISQDAATAGSTLPVITVVNPSHQSDSESVSGVSIPGIRMSTIPQSDTEGALAALDFNTSLLSIDTNRILELMPSLFAIDSIISAILTVAVADQTTNPIMAQMELWKPKPVRHFSTLRGPVSEAGTTTGSVFYATIAEREEAEEEAREMRKMHQEDVRKTRSQQKKSRNWYGRRTRSKSPKRKTKKVMMGEFDLEKLGTYQAGDRKGEQLPGVTRSLLSVLVGGLRFIVWFLTLIVRFLAWILVNVTRGVTSEKF